MNVHVLPTKRMDYYQISIERHARLVEVLENMRSGAELPASDLGIVMFEAMVAKSAEILFDTFGITP